MNKRTTIRFRTLIRFSLPYLLILAILCVLSGATSQSTYQLMLEESMEYHLLALNDSMRLLERTLAGLDAFSATLNHYEPLTKVLYASEGAPLVSNLLALREELMYYSDTNGILRGLSSVWEIFRRDRHGAARVFAARMVLWRNACI